MDTPPAPVLAEFPNKEDRTWAMAVHLAAFAGHVVPFAHLTFANILVPLAIWAIKKDQSRFLDDQGKESLNAQISFTIYSAVIIPMCFFLVGIPLFAALYIANLVLVIVAAIAAHDGKHYRYPGILRLVK